MIHRFGKLQTLNPDVLSRSGLSHFKFLHQADYQTDGSEVQLDVVLLNQDNTRLALVAEQDLDALIGDSDKAPETLFNAIASALSIRPVDLNSPLPLTTVQIPKPWGEEIWYTGIEARGVSKVLDTPLPWLLDIFAVLLGIPNPPMLLKILAPAPEENLGDLYFEMHEYKTEVYVVTAIDASSWPDGVGKIRFGFEQAMLDEYPNSQAFFSAYLSAVKDYQGVRREIDQRLDETADNANISQPLSTSDQQYLLGSMPEDLLASEKTLRETMYRFTSLKDITVGDIIRVPPFLPHSLQHGVRVIEFQTPHYERYILSFGQKVLTQDHWDTESIASRVKIASADISEPDVLEPGIDLVASFDAFKVLRLQLEPGGHKTIQHSEYAVCIGIEGEVQLHAEGNLVLHPEQAALVKPGVAQRFENLQNGNACVLVALAQP